MRKRFYGLSCCLLLVLLSGCQKTPETNAVVNKEGQATLIHDNAIGDDGVRIRTRLNVPDTVQHEIECNNDYTTIKVDAAVVVPESSSIPVYSVRIADLNESVVQHWAENFFDEGKIRRDYGYWEEEYTRLLATAPEELPYDKEVDYQFGEREIEEYYYLNDGNTTMWKKPYHCLFLVGEYQGKQYKMTAYKDSVNGTIRIRMSDEEKLFHSQIHAVNVFFSPGNYTTKDNNCSISFEDAVKMCDDFLTEMGITDMKVKYVQDAEAISSYGKTDAFMEYEKKGYYIYYYRDYGVIGDCFSNKILSTNDYFWKSDFEDYESTYANLAGDYNLEEGHSIPTLSERLAFLVSDDGILAVEYQNPMENVEKLAENVELLPFDKVLDSAYAYLEVMYDEEGDELRPKSLSIGQIELNLARVQNPNAENEFTMLPVWDFRGGTNGRIIVTVNAIDGSIIDRNTGH